MTPQRSALLAAALNVSGLGGGYLFLRAWRLFAVHVVGLLIWWFVSDGGAGGLVALVAWILLSVVVGAVLGGRRARAAAAIPPGGVVLTDPAPSTAPAHVLWRAPVAATIAAVLAATSLTAVGVYNSSAASALVAARDAHTGGDCATALEHLGSLSDGFLRRNVTAPDGEVDAESGACRLLQDARAQESEPGTAVETYDTYLARDAARFAGAADEQASARLAHADELAGQGDLEGAVTEFTTVAESGLDAAQEVPDAVQAVYDDAVAGSNGSCATSDTLEWFASNDAEVVAVVSDVAAERLPGTLLNCAEDLFELARQSVQDDPRAYDETLFDTARSEAAEVRDGYPGTTAGAAAEALISRIDDTADRAAQRRRELKIIDDIEATTGGKLEQPRSSGSSGTGSAEVVVENGTAETLEVLWTGPTTGKVRIDPGDAGDDCTDYRSRPTESISLPSGTYTVVVQTVTDSGVTPFKGTWDMGAGTRYGECYYIESSYGGYDPYDLDDLLEPIEP